MNELRVESTRSGVIESVHRVSVAVVDQKGQLFASSGDANRVTFWRSAAKPFQALPFVQDGAMKAFDFGEKELALACASHSSEAFHRELCLQMLKRIDATEEDLACGPHPLSQPTLAEEVLKQGVPLTSVFSNCSGKHTAMLAMARHRRWNSKGYEREGHLVQERILREVCRWTQVPRAQISLGVDGCTAVCFALPLSSMAYAYARLGTSNEPEAQQVANAMMQHPEYVGGTGRLCTELMQAFPGQILAKVGAEGIYCASLPSRGLGIALKVESGDNRANRVALLEVLRQLQFTEPAAQLPHHARLELHNTRNEVTGSLEARGELFFE